MELFSGANYMRQHEGKVIILTKTSMYFFSILLGINPLCWANEGNRFFHATIKTIKKELDSDDQFQLMIIVMN